MIPKVKGKKVNVKLNASQLDDIENELKNYLLKTSWFFFRLAYNISKSRATRLSTISFKMVYTTEFKEREVNFPLSYFKITFLFPIMSSIWYKKSFTKSEYSFYVKQSIDTFDMHPFTCPYCKIMIDIQEFM